MKLAGWIHNMKAHNNIFNEKFAKPVHSRISFGRRLLGKLFVEGRPIFIK